ncbi:MAG: YdcH family protein [Nitrospiraceae bacterium]|nr:YdcH family protein [Nitrospiraceae bacterium]
MKEQEIIESLKSESEEFRKLLEEHHSLDASLSEMDKKVYLTPEEEVERKKLQKVKLAKKDKMAEFIRDFRKSHPVG